MAEIDLTYYDQFQWEQEYDREWDDEYGYDCVDYHTGISTEQIPLTPQQEALKLKLLALAQPMFRFR